jgi:hypothetical protein
VGTNRKRITAGQASSGTQIFFLLETLNNQLWREPLLTDYLACREIAQLTMQPVSARV